MNKISFLSGNMDNANLEMVIKNDISDGIVIRSTEGFSDKGEEISTTEYFLDVQDQSVNEENADAQFLSVETSSEDNGNNQFIAVEVEDSGEIILHNKNVIIWSDICRICANGSDQFIPIFNGEGLENDLSNKINNYLPLKVSEDDNFPHQVCYSCAATLIAWHDMLTGCLEAQQQLQELQTKINLKDQLYNDTATEEDNIQSVTEIDTVTIEDKKINLKEDSSMETIQSIDAIESDRFGGFDEGLITTLTTESATAAMPAKKSRKKKSGDQLLTKRQFKTKSSLGKKRSVGPASGSNPQKFQRRLEASQAKVVMNGVAYYKCPACPKLLSTSYNYFAHKNTHAHARPCKCDMCGKSFTASSSLTRHVREVHYQIKNYGCGFCERKLASKIARDEHERTHTNERPNVCDTCGKSFRQRASLSVHRRFHLKNYQFNCQLCSREFRRKQDLQRHELTHTDERPYGCEQCSKRFRSSASASRHRQTHDHAKLACNECGQTCAGEKCLRSHMRSAHNVESKSLQNVSTNFKKFQRTFKHTLPPAKSSKISRNQSQSIKREVTRAVNKKRLQKVMKIEVTEVKTINSLINEEEFYESENSNFDSVKLKAAPSNDTEKSDNDSLEENAVSSSDSSESKKSDNSKYKKVRRLAITPGVECSHCGKKFRQYNSYQIHMRIHTGEKPYTCHICGKQFGQGGSLYYHLKHVHGGVKNHACDICGRCFAMKTAMEDHRRIHTGERPYVCDSCGKTFKTKASLYIHSKIHTDEYPFKCEYCKKLFRWKQQMISHLTTHTGEKNHICDICGKAFGVKNELTRHRRTHSLDKPFTCQKCGVSFGQKRYLTNHNRTRHRINASSSN